MSQAIVTLKKGEGRLLKSGGAWVFDNEIASIVGEFENGDIVIVHDYDGYGMGRGFINMNSKIRIRMMTRKQEQEINYEFLEMRVRDAWEYRKKTVDTGSCRVIFGEADFLPGLVIDKFEDVLVVQSLALGIDKMKEEIIDILKELLNKDGIKIRGVYERSDAKVRKQEGMELAKQIEQLFKDRCAEFKEEYKLNFGVYYTPAENLCYTSLKKFREKYGIIPNVSDKEFFTNSIHVPVWKEMSPYDKIDIESQLTGYSSAGCITYVELDTGIKNNLEALEQIVNYAMDNDIPYFAINVPNDTCLDCGYCDEFNDTCPMCGSTHIQQLRRVTGYLTGNYKTAFNLGKQDEVEHRTKHGGKIE